ncbi:MAG: ElyC/SanA/YdcF family protein [Ruthenibacterium lactatiformans]
MGQRADRRQGASAAGRARRCGAAVCGAAKKKTGREPCLIMSGGQGRMSASEAEAMREYAMEKVIRRSLCWRKHSRRTRRKIFIFQARGRGAQRGQAVLLYLCDKRLPSAAGGAVRWTGRLFL